MYSIDIFIQDRRLIQAALAGLSEEAYFTIPQGFDNNIAWNLGHIIVTQQALHYRLSGLPTVTTKEDLAMFKTGSSPSGVVKPRARPLSQSMTALGASDSLGPPTVGQPWERPVPPPVARADTYFSAKGIASRCSRGRSSERPASAR